MLLGFDLCVWLRDLAERKLYLPAGVALPEGLERLPTGRVSLRKIREGWDPLLRLVASIRRGLLSPKEALERLGRAAAGDPMRDAADALGKLLRTIFLCDFLTQPAFRRELRTLLNRGESVHQLQRAIYHGRLGHQRGRRREELVAVSGAHALLTNKRFQWGVVGHYLTAASVIDGLELTLWLTAATMSAGFVLGVVIAYIRLWGSPIPRAFAFGYVWLIRSVPLLVQLLFWYELASLYPSLSIGVPFGPSFASAQTAHLRGR